MILLYVAKCLNGYFIDFISKANKKGINSLALMS